MTLLEELFRIANEEGASDVHIAVGKPPIMRLNGNLVPFEDMPVVSAELAKRMALSLLTKEQYDRFLAERELDMSNQISELYRVRLNFHFEKGAIGIVARLIPSQVPTTEELAIPDSVLGLLTAPQGLILVTGPTGCGKSTTLAAMIDWINQQRTAHIVTLEDPIEFVFESKKSIIKQRQLGTDLRSFAAGLKHVVRQDPNVIMVGEMRDLETMAATISLAETGHLVLATLHTLSAAQTIDRIIDQFPSEQQKQVRLQLALSLKAILAQQLIPRVDGAGRVAARELLINTPAVANLIRENKINQIQTVIQTSAELGMFTMDQSLKKLVEDDVIAPALAKMYAANPMEVEG